MQPVFFHLPKRTHTFKLHTAEELQVETIFVGQPLAWINLWRSELQTYLAETGEGQNFALASMGEIEERSYAQLVEEHPFPQQEGEVCLEFLTPIPFRPDKQKRRTVLSKKKFVELFEQRLTRLFGESIRYEPGTDDFSVLPYYWNYTEIKRASASQPGSVQYVNGCAGKLYLKGRYAQFLPFLILGTELHAGTTLANGQGYYLLHADSPGYFEKFFPNKQSLDAVAQNVLEKYDHAAESLAAMGTFPFDEKKFVAQLFDDLKAGTYTPSPNTGFTVRKKSGDERLLEQPAYRDLIVQEYLLKTFSDVTERMFEEESIGFRRGLSRGKAAEMVQAAMQDGFKYVIESDIEDFFPSVDQSMLRGLLHAVLPERDALLRETLLRCIQNGYVLNGTLHDRTKGLAQGSPLSPMMANLYLDAFDETIKQWNVRLIRYADDFIILTKTEEDAHRILSDAESYLGTLGLKLKKAKTSVKPLSEGFQFLGIRFTGNEVQLHPEEELHLTKKPLYVTEPYLFLAISGDAIEIKRGKEVLETIPLRRVSEILLLEKASFSTMLVQRCANFGIPLSMALESGYHIATIIPDNRSLYDVSYIHAAKYAALEEVELLALAKEFAAAKIENYDSLFRQRYKAGRSVFLDDVQESVRSIHAAASLNEVRGIEGACARKTFQELNTIIDDVAFHIRKRDRKEPDRINGLMNFGYYLLFSRINATVRAAGLNPYLGFLHSPANSYESLVADLVELFRSRIDRFLLRILNLKIITPTDFEETPRGLYLTREARKRFLNAFEGEMERKSNDEELSLKENIYVQVRVVRGWAQENKTLSFYRWHV